jgi:hypothetical protein
MATGLKYNNLSVIDGISFQDKYDTAAGVLTAAIAANLSILQLKDERGDRVIGWYFGTAAIAATLTAMIQFPKGTIIYDLQAHTTVEKTGAVGTNTWVTSAARA